MARRLAPTLDDRAEVARLALSGIADGDDLGAIARRLDQLHSRHDTFVGEVLLDLAADAIETSGATREAPIEFEAIRKRYLAEDRAHTRAQHHKVEYALRAAAMIRGGVDPAVLDEVRWWRTDDLAFWALEALVTYVRAAADRSGRDAADICALVADRRGLALSPVAE